MCVHTCTHMSKFVIPALCLHHSRSPSWRPHFQSPASASPSPFGDSEHLSQEEAAQLLKSSALSFTYITSRPCPWN